jgi:rubrerythrin
MDDLVVCCETPMVRHDEFNEAGVPISYYTCRQCGYTSEPAETSESYDV